MRPIFSGSFVENNRTDVREMYMSVYTSPCAYETWLALRARTVTRTHMTHSHGSFVFVCVTCICDMTHAYETWLAHTWRILVRQYTTDWRTRDLLRCIYSTSTRSGRLAPGKMENGKFHFPGKMCTYSAPDWRTRDLLRRIYSRSSGTRKNVYIQRIHTCIYMKIRFTNESYLLRCTRSGRLAPGKMENVYIQRAAPREMCIYRKMCIWNVYTQDNVYMKCVYTG